MQQSAQRICREEFEINAEVIIENFSDHPERVCSISHIIEILSRHLMERDYSVNCLYDGCPDIPQSVLVSKSHETLDGDRYETKKDFNTACEFLGICPMFE